MLPLLRKSVFIVVIILSEKNMKEGLLFGFKGLTLTKGDFFALFLFSLFFVVSSPCVDVITTFLVNFKRTFGCNTF